MIELSSPNIKIVKGNIFTSKCRTIVNTVNTFGVMGAGIALEFKFRYPEMFERYVELCNEKKIEVGKLWLYKAKDGKIVLNFPTKIHWKYPTKIEYLEKGLQKFVNTYKQKGIESIAFPLLGAAKGGLDAKISLEIMERYLSNCHIPIEIYKYDPNAYDDLFIKFRNVFLETNPLQLKEKTGLRSNYLAKIKDALMDDSIRSLSRLATVKGVGLKSLEKSFKFAMSNEENQELTLGL